MNTKSGFRLIAYITLTVMFFAAMNFVSAEEVPMGAQSVIEGYESTINQSNYVAQSINAYAGNISELTLYGRSQTKHWQGYYGEVTGLIVLDDAQNWTMYDWPNNEPKGEIYATPNQTTPNWPTIKCFDFVGGADGNGFANVTLWEDFFNMTWNDVDGLDETFNLTTNPQFDVGEFTIQPNTCPTTYTHVNDDFQTDKYAELLLQDDAGQIIFTTIIENDDNANNTDPIGYNTVSHDFQMLVAEDGTSRSGGVRNQAITTYWFYLDLQ
jgi:hypothetical protein